MNNLQPPPVHCPQCNRYMGAFFGKSQCVQCRRWHISQWPDGAMWIDLPVDREIPVGQQSA